jgi:phage gp29-like protein
MPLWQRVKEAIGTLLPPANAPKPERGIWYSGQRDDYATSPTLKNLTPEKLSTALRSADQGDTYQQFEIFDLVEEDPHVAAVASKRRSNVTSRKLIITPAREGDAQAQAAADLCEESVLGRDGQGGIAGWRDALWDLTDALTKGVAVQQIVWDLEGSRYVPRALVTWPQRELVLGRADTMGRLVDPDVVRIVTDRERLDGEELQPWGWIVHRDKARSVPLARAARMRAVVWFYCFKRWSWKDWAIFIERFGTPMRLGKYPPGASDPDKRALLQAVLQMGRDAAAIVPTLSTIELIETGTLKSAGGGPPHPVMVKACNEEISKAIMGNTMSADQGERGARSAKESYSAEELQLAETDAEKLCETIRHDLFTPLVRLNLGPAAPIPLCRLAATQVANLEEAQRDKVVIREIGLKAGERYLREKYGIPAPKDGEETIGGLPPPPPAPVVAPPAGEDQSNDAAEEPEQPDQAAASRARELAAEIVALAAVDAEIRGEHA